MTEVALGEELPFDPTAPLTASGNLGRRTWVSRLFAVGASAAAVVAVAMLAIVLYAVASRGASQLSWSFVTQNSVTAIAPFVFTLS